MMSAVKSFWYIPAKEGQKYAIVGCSEWANAYAEMHFSELKFISDDDFYHVYAYATNFAGVENFNDKNWKFEPQLVKFRVARRNYQKDDKNKGKVDVKQSRLEKWLCHLFSEMDEDSAYSGFLALKDDSQLESFITNTDVKGEPLDPVIRNFLLQKAVLLEPIETLQHIKPEDIEIPKGKTGYGKGYGKPAQTELEKLNDRLTFICQQVNAYSTIQAENIPQLIDLMGDNPNIEAIFKSCLEIMS
jgi:hypothetical protein